MNVSLSKKIHIIALPQGTGNACLSPDQLAAEKQSAERSAREQIAADASAIIQSHRAPRRLHGGAAQIEHRRVEPQNRGFAHRMPIRDAMSGAMPMAHADEVRRDE